MKWSRYILLLFAIVISAVVSHGQPRVVREEKSDYMVKAIKAMMGDNVEYETIQSEEGVRVKARGEEYIWRDNILIRVHP